MKESQNAHSAKENIVPYRHTCLMTAEQHRKFDKFLKGDDLDFYEEYVINLTNKQQEAFFEDNPNFMSEYPISHERVFLLKDRIFRNILHKIKDYKRKRPSNEI